MAETPDKIKVVHTGARARILYWDNANGGMPARKFFLSLDEKQQKKFMYLFDRMCSHGSISNPEQFSPERDGISVFKIWQRRIYCFRDGEDWLLTDGAVKKKNKANPKDIDFAVKAMEEWRARKRKGRSR